MLELIAADQNQVFVIALVIMFIIAAIEGVAAMLGAGVFAVLDSIMPDIDADIDIDIDGPETAPPPFTRLLGWLRVGQVPILVLIVTFLTGFGLIGLCMQSLVHGLAGFYLPAALAWVPALVCTLPVVRGFAGLLAALLPRDETEAVSQASFVGRIATITLGQARVASPAEAKVTDEFGQTHYIMVEPDRADAVFEQGQEVLVTEDKGATFAAILNTKAVLSNRKGSA